MPNVPIMPAKDFLSCLLKYGCVLVSINGSHFKIKNPNNGRVAPIPVHGNRDIDKPFSKAILVQLGIDINDFLKFIKNG